MVDASITEASWTTRHLRRPTERADGRPLLHGVFLIHPRAERIARHLEARPQVSRSAAPSPFDSCPSPLPHARASEVGRLFHPGGAAFPLGHARLIQLPTTRTLLGKDAKRAQLRRGDPIGLPIRLALQHRLHLGELALLMGLRATPALGCEELDGVHGPLHLVDAQGWPRSVLSGQSTEKLRDDKCNLKRWHSKKKAPSTETLQGRHDLQSPPLGGAVSLRARGACDSPKWGQCRCRPEQKYSKHPNGSS